MLRFKSENSTKISDISHNETAWQKYVDSGADEKIRYGILIKGDVESWQ